MQARLRVLFVGFLCLALPLQGMASVTMTHCGPGHERMTPAARQEAAHSAHGAHGTAEAHASHDHGSAISQAHAEAASVADDAGDAGALPVGDESGRFTDLAKYKCSSCAACCAGAALPSPIPAIAKPMDAPSVFADPTVAVAFVATDGPDRPPRP